MGAGTIIQQSNFIAGEVSPFVYGRVDVAFYQQALRTCKNFFVSYHGGVMNRPGTDFIGRCKNDDDRARAIPFQFNVSDTYILEFGEQYIRFYRNAGRVLESAKTVTGATQADPVVITISTHGYSNGDWVYLSDIGGMTELNGKYYKVANKTASTFELTDLDDNDIDGTGFTAFTSGGDSSRVYEISSPYAVEDLPTLKFTQSADVMTLVHPDYEPRELSRTGHTSWSLDTITFDPEQAAPTGLTHDSGGGSGSSTYEYKVTAVSDGDELEESLPSTKVTITSAAANFASDPIDLSWTAATGAGKYNVYRAQNGIYGYVGSADGTTFTDDYIDPVLDDTPPDERDPFDAVDSYPSTVTYYQQRIVYANTNDRPQTVFTSKSSNYKNFTYSQPPKADDAITFTIASRQVNEIRHLLPLNQLLALTSGGEWLVYGGDSVVLQPTNVVVQAQSYNGCSEVQPIVIGNSALYIQNKGSIVRDLTYSLELDGFGGNDISVRSSHLFTNKVIEEWAHSTVPHNLVWAIRDDGVALSLTYLREQNVVGWARHDTDGEFESVATVSEGMNDAVYFSVKRTINGNDVRYIERLHTRFFEDIEDAFFVDSGLTYDGRNESDAITATVNEWAGGGYDAGATVRVDIDGLSIDSSYVGDSIVVTSSDGDNFGTVKITSFVLSSPSYFLGTLQDDLHEDLQTVATSDWSRAIDSFSNLDHLEGKQVSVLADGSVFPSQTVTNGSVTLSQDVSVVHIGLGYESDFETLDIETNALQSTKPNKTAINSVSLLVNESRGIFAGRDFDNLTEYKQRTDEAYGQPIQPTTGLITVPISNRWEATGRIAVRQSDPLPLTILAVLPEVTLAGKA